MSDAFRWRPRIAAVARVAALGHFGHGRHVVLVRPGGAVLADEILPIFFLLSIAPAMIAVW